MNNLLQLNSQDFSHYEEISSVQGTFFINSRDSYIARDLRTEGWEKYLTDYFKDTITPNQTVIDIGSFVGTHTITLSKLVGPHGRVFAFEPFKHSYLALLYNIFRNKCFNVTVIQKGISNEKCMLKIPMNAFDCTEWKNYGALQLQDVNENGIDVECVPLDDYVNEFQDIALIKIDTEGMELQVLRGAKLILERFKPIIVVEIHYETDGLNIHFQEVDNYLASIGYYKEKQFIHGPNDIFAGHLTYDFLYKSLT